MERCKYYPEENDQTCVCYAGSDVSGTYNNIEMCDEKYSNACLWRWERDQLLKSLDIVGYK